MKMKWFRNFMAGRYGYDQLNTFLLILSLILCILGLLLWRPLQLLYYIPLIYCFYRMFSRSIYRREKENEKFLEMGKPVRKWYKRSLNRWKYRKTHKYFKCPYCHQYLRVPKGKGQIEINCPHCHNHFDRKT